MSLRAGIWLFCIALIGSVLGTYLSILSMGILTFIALAIIKAAAENGTTEGAVCMIVSLALIPSMWVFGLGSRLLPGLLEGVSWETFIETAKNLFLR